MYPTINIFGTEAGTYTLSFLAGFIACIIFALHASKMRSISRTHLLTMMVISVLGMIAGGHLLFFIVKLCNIITDSPIYGGIGLRRALYMSFDSCTGQVFYGGLIGALAVFLLCVKLSKPEDPCSMLDIYASSVPLFHFFGRIGCFLGGCCYGIESPFGLLVTSNANVPSINGVMRFPVQLLEALLNMALFFVLLYFFKKRRYQGKLIYIYLASYAVLRFFTEFLRGDDIRGIFLHLSTSQWISLALILLTLPKLKNIIKNSDKSKRCV